ncbi:MAG TPA: hypothetical protein DDZ91_08340 [Firmicutes bacterium]|jgi:predicted NBD/HSP70 family sugar kinase|nr:hypothetical protein [Bacillota bacterium]
MEIRNTRELKQYNKFIILNEIIENQPVSRKDLTKKMEASHATISYIVKDLIEEGLVVETEFMESNGGRPPRLLEFKGSSKFLIAVEIIDQVLWYSIFNLNLELIKKSSFSTEELTAQEIINLSYSKIIKELEELDIDFDKLIGLGVSTPGIYEEDIDRLTNSTSKIWEGSNIKKEFQKKFKLPVYIENDANLAAYYEWAYGAGRGYSNLIYIYIADGIGGGLIINNQLYKGIHGKAGEIGHVKVKEEGEKCDCGGIGCLETVSSIKAIRKEINKRISNGEKSNLLHSHQPPFTADEVIKAYREGDPLSREIIDRAFSYLMNALSSIINLYDPGLLILGDMHDFIDDELINRFKTGLKKICFPNIMEKLDIVKKTDKESNLQMHATAAFVFDIWKKTV